MTLSEAEQIADNPDHFSALICQEAMSRLKSPRVVARMRNVRTEATLRRYDDRLTRLYDAISAAACADEVRRI